MSSAGPQIIPTTTTTTTTTTTPRKNGKWKWAEGTSNPGMKSLDHQGKSPYLHSITLLIT
jgi:hypothetical protein